MPDLFIYRQQIGERHEIGSYQIAICLGSSGVTSEGQRLLTATRASAHEWDAQVNTVIRRLEELRREGKEFLR